MSEENKWEMLFANAIKLLKQGGVPNNLWAFGGGTVLMQKFNHRQSKDIDIFFQNPQLLNYISPRVNDAVEGDLIACHEQYNYTKLVFREGELDFIVSSQISAEKPTLRKICGIPVNVEHPVEIIAKKIHYRAKEFKPRDVFDLAMVYNSHRECLLSNCNSFADNIPELIKQVDYLEQTGKFEERLQALVILPGGEKVRGKEMQFFRDFVASIERTMNKINEVELHAAEPDRVYLGEIIGIQDEKVIQEISPGIAFSHDAKTLTGITNADIGKHLSIAYDRTGAATVTEGKQLDWGNEIDR